MCNRARALTDFRAEERPLAVEKDPNESRTLQILKILSGDSLIAHFFTFVNLRFFFLLSFFFRRDNQKVAEMVIFIVQLQSCIK